LIDALSLLENNFLNDLDLFVSIIEDPVVGVVVPIPEIYNIMPFGYLSIMTQYSIEIIFIFLLVLAFCLFIEFRMGKVLVLLY